MPSYHDFRLCLAFLVVAQVSITPAPAFCTPEKATKGEKQSVTLVVKEYSKAAADFQQYPAKLLSTMYHKLQNDGSLIDLSGNIRARFSGANVCVSAVRLSVADERGVNEKKEFSCERACVDTSSPITLTLNTTEGGRVWPGSLCCVWSRERYLVLSLQRLSHECVTCRGKECNRPEVRTKQCAPGARCFSLTLQRPTSRSLATPLYSGCTNDALFSGYSCWNDCRHSVRVAGSDTKSRVCLHCCTGDNCNKDFNVTRMNTTVSPTVVEFRARQDWKAHNHAGRPLNASIVVFTIEFCLFVLSLLP